MEHSKIQLLADDMNDIYSFIYKEEWDRSNPGLKGTSREEPYIHYRHIVRYMVCRERAVYYKLVASAEGLLFGITPCDHSTVKNSLDVVADNLRYKKEYRTLIHQIGFMYDLKKGYRDRGVNYADGINKMMSLPKHVLAVTLASVTHHNLVHETILNTLINEYQALDEHFLKSLLPQEVANV